MPVTGNIPTQSEEDASLITPPDRKRPLAASVNVNNKSFLVNSKTRAVLSDVHFDVYQREFLTILGPSGCGKTTLLRLIAGLDTTYDGSIIVGGKPVSGPGRDRGFMFQESRLLPWLRVERNISFAISSDVPRVKKSKIVDAALRLVGLSEYGRAWPSQLSGGMAKRVALARAIVNLPYLLLLDEPLTALDSPTKYGLQDEIARIHVAEKEMTTILVTHDVDEAVYLSDRILVLSPMGSKVLVEIPVPLTRPRDRTSGEYRVICSAVTNDIFEQWWKASAQAS
jgi:sulfonate transport system ATP-binding protein